MVIPTASTSSVNRTPPTGALNIPAIPAPAPQASRIRTDSSESLNHRARLLPIAAPVHALGPSAPAEPPNPIVTVQPNIGANRYFGDSLYF